MITDTVRAHASYLFDRDVAQYTSLERGLEEFATSILLDWNQRDYPGLTQAAIELLQSYVRAAPQNALYAQPAFDTLRRRGEP